MTSFGDYPKNWVSRCRSLAGKLKGGSKVCFPPFASLNEVETLSCQSKEVETLSCQSKPTSSNRYTSHRQTLLDRVSPCMRVM